MRTRLYRVEKDSTGVRVPAPTWSIRRAFDGGPAPHLPLRPSDRDAVSRLVPAVLSVTGRR